MTAHTSAVLTSATHTHKLGDQRAYMYQAFSTLSQYLSAPRILRYSPTAQKGKAVYQIFVISIVQVGAALLRKDFQIHVP